jgi:hypothetical protein
LRSSFDPPSYVESSFDPSSSFDSFDCLESPPVRRASALVIVTTLSVCPLVAPGLDRPPANAPRPALDVPAASPRTIAPAPPISRHVALTRGTRVSLLPSRGTAVAAPLVISPSTAGPFAAPAPLARAPLTLPQLPPLAPGAPAPRSSLRTASRPASLLPMYASFATLQALDYHSTRQALAGGSAAEANPLMRSIVTHPPAFIAVKAAATAGVIVMGEKMWKKNRLGAILFVAGANAAMAVVVGRNYAVR